jgi:hypothetical protein
MVFSLRQIPVENMFNFVHNYKSTPVTKMIDYEKKKFSSYIGVNVIKCLGASVSTLLRSCADFLVIWEPQPSGTLGACPGLYRNSFNFASVSG